MTNPLMVCWRGRVYLLLLGNLPNKELEKFSAVHLSGPHEWNPSILDYAYSSHGREPAGSQTPMKGFNFTLTLMNFGDYTQTIN